MDTITLTDCQVHAIIGILDFEQQRRQPLDVGASAHPLDDSMPERLPDDLVGTTKRSKSSGQEHAGHAPRTTEPTHLRHA